MKKIKVIVAVVIMALTLGACASQAQTVSYNVSKEADNFNVMRRLTVINSRSDKVVLMMVGKISIEDVTDGIAVIVEIDHAKKIYQKHYVYLNEWTMYTVEDVSGVEVSPYIYEMEFMPERIVPVKITTHELGQELEDRKEAG